MTEEDVDARLLAMRGAQQIREGALAHELRRGAEDLAIMRQQRDEYHKWWVEASTKLNKMIARQDEIKPLVILELETNEDVAYIRESLEQFGSMAFGDWPSINARFIAVLRPGQVDDDAG